MTVRTLATAAVVLDTNALLWLVTAPEKVSAAHGRCLLSRVPRSRCRRPRHGRSRSRPELPIDAGDGMLAGSWPRPPARAHVSEDLRPRRHERVAVVKVVGSAYRSVG